MELSSAFNMYGWLQPREKLIYCCLYSQYKFVYIIKPFSLGWDLTITLLNVKVQLLKEKETLKQSKEGEWAVFHINSHLQPQA